MFNKQEFYHLIASITVYTVFFLAQIEEYYHIKAFAILSRTGNFLCLNTTKIMKLQ